MIKKVTKTTKVIRRKANHVARKLSAAKIGPVDLPLHKGAWQVAKEGGKRIAGAPRKITGTKKPLALSDEVVASMAHDRETGMSVAQVSMKYAVSERYVAEAISRHHVSAKEGKAALRGVLLEGAIACGQQAKAKIDELNGMQSVVAAGIFTQRYIDMDKHIAENPEDVDMSQIERAGALIASLDADQEGQLLEDHPASATIDIDDDEPET